MRACISCLSMAARDWIHSIHSHGMFHFKRQQACSSASLRCVCYVDIWKAAIQGSTHSFCKHHLLVEWARADTSFGRTLLPSIFSWTLLHHITVCKPPGVWIVGRHSKTEGRLSVCTVAEVFRGELSTCSVTCLLLINIMSQTVFLVDKQKCKWDLHCCFCYPHGTWEHIQTSEDNAGQNMPILN